MHTFVFKIQTFPGQGTQVECVKTRQSGSGINASFASEPKVSPASQHQGPLWTL
jgi:hypothetical protein